MAFIYIYIWTHVAIFLYQKFVYILWTIYRPSNFCQKKNTWKFIASYKGTNYPYTFHASEPQKEMREDARFSFDNKNWTWSCSHWHFYFQAFLGHESVIIVFKRRIDHNITLVNAVGWMPNNVLETKQDQYLFNEKITKKTCTRLRLQA